MTHSVPLVSSSRHEDILENVMSDSRHSSEGGSNAICQIKKTTPASFAGFSPSATLLLSASGR